MQLLGFALGVQIVVASPSKVQNDEDLISKFPSDQEFAKINFRTKPKFGARRVYVCSEDDRHYNVLFTHPPNCNTDPEPLVHSVQCKHTVHVDVHVPSTQRTVHVEVHEPKLMENDPKMAENDPKLAENDGVSVEDIQAEIGAIGGISPKIGGISPKIGGKSPENDGNDAQEIVDFEENEDLPSAF